LAEAIFKSKITDNNLKDEIFSDSSGTALYHIEEPPDPRTIEIAQRSNLSVDHFGKQLTS